VKKNKPAFQGRLYHLPPIETNRKTTIADEGNTNPNTSTIDVKES